MAFAELGDSERAWELLRMLNPIRHGSSAEGVATYKVEPYVMAADVYAIAPHVGRGGWTWYTGSAGWTYRLIVESLLGVNLAGDKLTISPCLPNDWSSYQLRYRYRDTTYRITISQVGADGAACEVKVDGIAQSDQVIHLIDDRLEHAVEIMVPVRTIPPSTAV
jgi:cellobiose phosphorylase